MKTCSWNLYSCHLYNCYLCFSLCQNWDRWDYQYVRFAEQKFFIDLTWSSSLRELSFQFI